MQNQIIVYENGEIEIKVSIDSQNETIWLRTEDIALLFGVNRPAIVKHIGNIYKSNELEETLTCSILEQVIPIHINDMTLASFFTKISQSERR